MAGDTSDYDFGGCNSGRDGVAAENTSGVMRWIFAVALILAGCIAAPTYHTMPVVEPMVLGRSDRDYAVCVRTVALLAIKAQTVLNFDFVHAHCEQVRRSFSEQAKPSGKI